MGRFKSRFQDSGVFAILSRLKDECKIGADFEAEEIG